MTSIIDPGKPAIHILNQTEEGLLGRDAKFNVVPVLATAMPENPDPLTYIFKLREDVKFHDGTPLTADDVIYGYERLIDPKSGQLRPSIPGQHLQDGGRRQVHRQVHHEAAVAHLPLLRGRNHPKATQRSLGEKPDFAVKFWSGTGPFKVSEWVQGDHQTIVRNDNYWKAAPDAKPFPYLDKVVYKTIPRTARPWPPWRPARSTLSRTRRSRT